MGQQTAARTAGGGVVVRVVVRVVDGALGTDRPGVASGGAGAVVWFEGVVRPGEDGMALEALRYEVYPPMTERVMRELAGEVAAAFGLTGLVVEHSVGRVAVGETSFRLGVAAEHRREALDAMDRFIARMKAEVPIWKVPVFAGGEG
ncbi:MAG: molybdenum cofactor biosynthesis protein MoaE [Planctomycetota bacterium]